MSLARKYMPLIVSADELILPNMHLQKDGTLVGNNDCTHLATFTVQRHHCFFSEADIADCEIAQFLCSGTGSVKRTQHYLVALADFSV